MSSQLFAGVRGTGDEHGLPGSGGDAEGSEQRRVDPLTLGIPARADTESWLAQLSRMAVSTAAYLLDAESRGLAYADKFPRVAQAILRVFYGAAGLSPSAVVYMRRVMIHEHMTDPDEIVYLFTRLMPSFGHVVVDTEDGMIGYPLAPVALDDVSDGDWPTDPGGGAAPWP